MRLVPRTLVNNGGFNSVKPRPDKCTSSEIINKSKRRVENNRIPPRFHSIRELLVDVGQSSGQNLSEFSRLIN